MKKEKCCICGKEIKEGWGNNPWPISKDINDTCCNSCNARIVIPARLEIMLNEEKRNNK